jgi:hypothetical protein
VLAAALPLQQLHQLPWRPLTVFLLPNPACPCRQALLQQLRQQRQRPWLLLQLRWPLGLHQQAAVATAESATILIVWVWANALALVSVHPRCLSTFCHHRQNTLQVAA